MTVIGYGKVWSEFYDIKGKYFVLFVTFDVALKLFIDQRMTDMVRRMQEMPTSNENEVDMY